MEHVGLKRTSPKGEKFIGECIACGKGGLTFGQLWEECANPAGMTAGDALLEALTDEPKTESQT